MGVLVRVSVDAPMIEINNVIVVALLKLFLSLQQASIAQLFSQQAVKQG